MCWKYQVPTKHVWFENWDNSKSSSAIEASVILGFKLSEHKYGVCYAQFIEDGDIKVYKKF